VGRVPHLATGTRRRRDHNGRLLSRPQMPNALPKMIDKYVVWSEDKKPVAAFPQVDEAHTPEALADRVELSGFIPNDEDLLRPPAKPSGAKPAA
jgi:hypothetical protein